MKFFRELLVIAAGSTLSVRAENSYPVVLVHGLGGSAGNWQYLDEIEAEGLPTIAVNVGKVTSNWDRACEIYAQLEGTVVDYGVCHSQEFGHNRFGRDFTGQGLYPEWDADHPIHLFGHSMGGPTIVVLETILREGSGCAQDTSPFFSGGNKWVTSFTTFSGVLGGTSLIDLLTQAELMDLIKNLIVVAAGLIDNTFIDSVFEIDLGQWNLERAPGESFDDFWIRVEASGFLDPGNEDISSYDLSIEGVRAANAEGPLEYDDTYYFAFATERTNPKRDCFFFVCGDWYENADIGMNIFLQPFANWIGSTGDGDDMKNDGLVNWANQLCPIVEDSDRGRCQEYDGTIWPIGQWVYQDVYYLDHLQIITRDWWKDAVDYSNSAKKIYVDHAKRIKAL